MEIDWRIGLALLATWITATGALICNAKVVSRIMRIEKAIFKHHNEKKYE